MPIKDKGNHEFYEFKDYTNLDVDKILTNETNNCP